MNRKKVGIFIVVALLVILSALVSLLLLDSDYESVQRRAALPKVPQAKSNGKEQWVVIKELKKPNSEPTEASAKAWYESLPDKVKRYYYTGFESGIDAITFYGQVIDQFGQPVEGARVWIDIGGRYLAGGSGQAIGTTDANGRFSVRGEGGSLSVGPIKHPELDDYRRRASNGKIKRGASFTAYQHEEGGEDLLWTDYTNEENPYVFSVWRKTEETITQTLYKVRSTPIGFSCDGTIYSLDLEKPPKTKRKMQGEVGGQLRVRFNCKNKEHSRDGGDWSVELVAVDGGIQETEDVYLNEAPLLDYEPLYRLVVTQDNPAYQDRLEKRFYFTANGGQHHGSLEIQFDPYIDDVPIIFLTYKLNPTGTRALLAK